jgi:xanthine/CO dehydrogenase XdhC/CoxF family maturation factor
VSKFVRVIWLDSGMHMDYGWDKRERYLADANLGRMEVTTVGILMHEDEETVVVALNHDKAHDTWIGAQVIARQSIITMDLLYA